MKFHEFLLTVVCAITFTFGILGWLLQHDRLCVYTDPDRVRHCVVLVIR